MFNAPNSLKFIFVFWVVLPCKIIIGRRFRGTCCLYHQALVMEAARTSKTSVDNYFTRQYNPEDKSELCTLRRENLKSHAPNSFRKSKALNKRRIYIRFCVNFIISVRSGGVFL
jgi:hypothetical protein